MLETWNDMHIHLLAPSVQITIEYFMPNMHTIWRLYILVGDAGKGLGA